MRIIFLSVCVLQDKCSLDKDFFLSHSYSEAQLESEETVEAEQSTVHQIVLVNSAGS